MNECKPLPRKWGMWSRGRVLRYTKRVAAAAASSPFSSAAQHVDWHDKVRQSVTEQKQKQKAWTNHKLGSNLSDPNQSL